MTDNIDVCTVSGGQTIKAECRQCGAPLKDGKCLVQPWHAAELRDAESPRKPSADERERFLLFSPYLNSKDSDGCCVICGRYALNINEMTHANSCRAGLREFSQHPVPAKGSV